MKRGDLREWLKSSRRRTAVMKALTKPKTTSEIHEEALDGAVSFSNAGEVLGELEGANLVICVNPKGRIGRLYELTKRGRTLKNEIVGAESHYQDIPNEIVSDYAWVIRGKHRRAVIKVMDTRKTPSQIHRDVVRSCENLPKDSIYSVKLSLNSTSDTLRGFRKKGIAVCTNPERRVKRLYELTKKGKAIREQILKS